MEEHAQLLHYTSAVCIALITPPLLLQAHHVIRMGLREKTASRLLAFIAEIQPLPTSHMHMPPVSSDHS